MCQCMKKGPTSSDCENSIFNNSTVLKERIYNVTVYLFKVNLIEIEVYYLISKRYSEAG